MSLIEIGLAVNSLIVGWIGYLEMRMRTMSTDLKERLEMQDNINKENRDQLNLSIRRVEDKIDTLTMLFVNMQIKDMANGKTQKDS